MKRSHEDYDTIAVHGSVLISPRRPRRSPLTLSPIPSSAFVSIMSASKGSVFDSTSPIPQNYSNILSLLGGQGQSSECHSSSADADTRKLSFDDADAEEEEEVRMFQPLRDVLSNMSVYERCSSQCYHSSGKQIATAPQWNNHSRPSTPSYTTVMAPPRSPASSRSFYLHSEKRANSFVELHNRYCQSVSPPNAPADPYSSGSFLAFNILCSLGKGTSSEVYKVEDPHSLHEFAIKRSRQDSNRVDALKRERKSFLLEVETLYTLSVSHCPNVPRIYNAWEEDNHFYLLMEVANHGNLQDICSRYAQAGLPMASVVMGHTLHDICQALQHMHARGMVHLDIKPANLLLFAHGVVKLGDFGHSHVPNKKDGCEGDRRFVAKELPLAPHWDPQPSADIFSLGVSLYCMAQPSFDPPLEGMVWSALRTNQFQPLPNHLPDAMRSLVSWMLHADPCHRPSAEQILQHELVRSIDLLSHLERFDMMSDEAPPMIELNRSASFTSAMAVV